MSVARFSLLLMLVLLLVCAASLLAGRVWVAPSSFWNDPTLALIFVELRLPRLVLGLVIGAGLGMAGATMQGYLRNPLADPGLFGVSSSAALGAVLSLFFAVAGGRWLLPLCALAGAGAGMAVLVMLAGRSASVMLFTLAGLIVSSLTGALTALCISLAPSPFASSEIVTWLMGALTDRSWDDVLVAAPLCVLGMLVLAGTGRALDALSLGETAARSLGVDMDRLRVRVIAGVGLIAGASVAAAGVIGFVGLIVPHLVRPLAGHRPSACLLPSALGGALLVVAADALVRVVPSVSEVRLGIAMSLLGAPFFLALLLHMRREVA